MSLREVTLTLCHLCESGAGGECHSPGCALWMNRAPDVPLNIIASEPDLGRAANAMAGWLLESVGLGAAHDALCDLHPDTWKEVAEVTIRAGRGEFDHRPFTMRPGLPR